MVLAALGRPAQGQTTIVAGPTTTEIVASVGQQVTVPIAVDLTGAPGVKLGAYRLSFRWNPSLLSFVATAGGSFGAPVFNTDSAAQGVVKLAAAVPSGASGVVQLGGVTLEVRSIEAADTFDLAFQELVAAETFADLLPSLVVTGGLFCGGPVFGDVDNTGGIQARDAQIVLMYAVGLSLPHGTEIARGDVDANSKVDPRDALVILSKVVGLDVSQFRVGRFVVAACQGTSPAAVSILPRPVVLAQGDLFTLSAEVRDSRGKLMAGLNLGWSSSDTAKVKVTSSGLLRAVAQGSAVVTAAVAPGIRDTVTVTVGERHRWVVNPQLAQNQPSQVGSDLYPFSSIAQALARAQDGDTVFLASATYNEPISTTKQLVFLGDSTASILPTLSVPGGLAGVIVRPGLQIVRWIRVSNSAGGLWVSADRVEIGKARLNSLSGPALVVRGADTVRLSDVSVATAGGVGVMVDTAAVALFQRVRVAGVGGLPLPVLTGADYEVHAAGIVARADSVYLDSVAVEGVSPASLPDSQAVVGVLTVRSRVTSLRRVRISDIGWGERHDLLVLGIGADTVGTLVGDSLVVRRVGGSGIAIRGDTLAVRRARLEDVRGGVESEAQWVQIDSSAFSLQSRFDGCGIVLESSVAVALIRRVLIDQGAGGVCSSPVTGGEQVARVGNVEIRESVFRGSGVAIYLNPDSLTLESDTIVGAGWGVAVAGDSGSGSVRKLVARNLVVGPVPGAAFGAQHLQRVELVGLRTDSAGLGFDIPASVFVLDADTVLIQGSTIRNSQRNGFAALGSGRVVADSNEFVGSAGAGVVIAPLTRTGVDVWLSSNTIAQNDSFGVILPVLDALGSYDSIVVVKNTLRANRVGIGLDTVRAGTVSIDTNLVADNSQVGIALSRPAAGRLNSFFRNQEFGLAVFGGPGGADFGFSNFEGNAVAAYSAGPDSLYVRESWWGDVLGPRGCSTCDLSSSGDAILGSVAYLPFATDTVVGAPLGSLVFEASFTQGTSGVPNPITRLEARTPARDLSALRNWVGKKALYGSAALLPPRFFGVQGRVK